jgi:hypothetical protein
VVQPSQIRHDLTHGDLVRPLDDAGLFDFLAPIGLARRC